MVKIFEQYENNILIILNLIKYTELPYLNHQVFVKGKRISLEIKNDVPFVTIK